MSYFDNLQAANRENEVRKIIHQTKVIQDIILQYDGKGFVFKTNCSQSIYHCTYCVNYIVLNNGNLAVLSLYKSVYYINIFSDIDGSLCGFFSLRVPDGGFFQMVLVKNNYIATITLYPFNCNVKTYDLQSKTLTSALDLPSDKIQSRFYVVLNDGSVVYDVYPGYSECQFFIYCKGKSTLIDISPNIHIKSIIPYTVNGFIVTTLYGTQYFYLHDKLLSTLYGLVKRKIGNITDVGDGTVLYSLNRPAEIIHYNPATRIVISQGLAKSYHSVSKWYRLNAYVRNIVILPNKKIVVSTGRPLASKETLIMDMNNLSYLGTQITVSIGKSLANYVGSFSNGYILMSHNAGNKKWATIHCYDTLISTFELANKKLLTVLPSNKILYSLDTEENSTKYYLWG